MVGIESSLQEELDFLRKSRSLMTMKKGIEAFNEYDKICAIYGFMMFNSMLYH